MFLSALFDINVAARRRQFGVVRPEHGKKLGEAGRGVLNRFGTRDLQENRLKKGFPLTSFGGLEGSRILVACPE